MRAAPLFVRCLYLSLALVRRAFLFEHFVDFVPQFVGGDGLGRLVVDAGLERVDDVVFVAAGREHDDRQGV